MDSNSKRKPRKKVSMDPVIDHRRRQVAALKLRGLTLREIEEALAKAGLMNPKTGKPWDLKTVWKDVTHLQAEWKEEARKDTDDHRARLLAEIGAAKRAAWNHNDLDVVLKAIKEEKALLGVDAPLKVAPTTPEGKALPMGMDLSRLTLDQLEALEGIVKAATPGEP